MIARSFDRWIEHQDENVARAAGSLSAWIGSSLFVCLFLPVLAYAPVARDYFALQLLPALVCWIPACIGGLVSLIWTARVKVFSRGLWIAQLVGSSLVQFFCASLITWSRGRGAPAMSSLFVFSAAYHGHVLRVRPTEPFLVLGTIASIVIAALLDPSPDRLGLFVFVGAAAVTAELLLGSSARRWTEARTRADRLSAALQANVMDEHAQKMQQLSETLVDVMARTHDINNTLMGLKLSVDALGFEHQRNPAAIPAIVADLETGLERMRGLAAGIKAVGTAGRPGEAEAVDVIPLVDAALLAIGARFPGVRQRFTVDRSVTLQASLRGGAMTLRRIVDNLLLNACQGDGTRGATQIAVEARRDPSGGRLLVTVSDDGPGFSEAQLAQPIEVFASTKTEGTGLGLFTCERLLRASGGQLERANLVEGGAQLTAILPLFRT